MRSPATGIELFFKIYQGTHCDPGIENLHFPARGFISSLHELAETRVRIEKPVINGNRSYRAMWQMIVV